MKSDMVDTPEPVRRQSICQSCTRSWRGLIICTTCQRSCCSKCMNHDHIRTCKDCANPEFTEGHNIRGTSGYLKG